MMKKIMRKRELIWALALVAGLGSPEGQAQAVSDNPLQDEAGYGASTLESRVARLEKKTQTQANSEYARELERLKDDVRKLRGTIEELKNELAQHRDAQAQQLADLAARVPGQSQAAAGSATAGAPASPVVQNPNLPPPVAAPARPSAVDAALSAPPQPLAPPPDPMERQKEYEHAFETLKAAKYTDAAAEFQAFVAKYPKGEFSDSAQYWLGEAHYSNRAFVAAREAFKKMLADFPQSAKVADAKLKLGFIEYENQQYPKARELLNEVLKGYPETAAAKMAEKRLERMKQENH